jgi:hypothetical protein
LTYVFLRFFFLNEEHCLLQSAQVPYMFFSPTGTLHNTGISYHLLEQYLELADFCQDFWKVASIAAPRAAVALREEIFGAVLCQPPMDPFF